MSDSIERGRETTMDGEKEAVRIADRDVMRVMLPGGGHCRVIVAGEFGPRQMRALIHMLEVTADVLADDLDEDARALASTGEDGGGDGR